MYSILKHVVDYLWTTPDQKSLEEQLNDLYQKLDARDYRYKHNADKLDNEENEQEMYIPENQLFTRDGKEIF